VASVSRIDKITGFFCKRALSKRRIILSILLTVNYRFLLQKSPIKETYNFIDLTDRAKETYNFIDLTDRSQPIGVFDMNRVMLKLRGLF